MDFIQRLRPGVQRGEITCSIRIWQRPRVKPGNRYSSTGVGQIEIDSVTPIELSQVTPALARESGFAGVVDLLKIAKHGSGSNVYLVRFHYVGSEKAKTATTAEPRRLPNAEQRRDRVAQIVTGFPEAEANPAGRHLSLEVRKKRFGWFLDDHHGDGRIALNCKGSAQLHDLVQRLAPKHFHVPKYLGNKGWIGFWLDKPKPDWAAVELTLRESYLLVAPKKLRSAGSPLARGAK